MERIGVHERDERPRRRNRRRRPGHRLRVRYTAPVRPGGGRQAAYSGEMVLGTEHNRANAGTRRRQLREAGVGTDRAVTEPVTVARAAAGSLLARFEAAIGEQGRLAGALVAELRTMGDPTAAAAQASASTEVARAEAATARAEAAEDARAEADAAVAAARQNADDARTELAEQVQATAAQAEAPAEQTRRAEADTARLQATLHDVTGQRDAARIGADQLRTDLATARTEAAAAAASAAREASLIDQVDRLTIDLTPPEARSISCTPTCAPPTSPPRQQSPVSNEPKPMSSG